MQPLSSLAVISHWAIIKNVTILMDSPKGRLLQPPFSPHLKRCFKWKDFLEISHMNVLWIWSFIVANTINTHHVFYVQHE